MARAVTACLKTLSAAALVAAACQADARAGDESGGPPQPTAAAPAAADMLLGSRRVRVARTPLDSQWQRVRGEGLPRHQLDRVMRLLPAGDEGQLLRSVNAFANRSVRYRSDQALYGQADHWADAGETLARGAGDCEDLAILKMQLLSAAGMTISAMHLTIVRDLRRDADHAVLVVRTGGREWLLDSGTDQPLAAEQARAYRPVMSFGAHGSWLHGYRERHGP